MRYTDSCYGFASLFGFGESKNVLNRMCLLNVLSGKVNWYLFQKSTYITKITLN